VIWVKPGALAVRLGRRLPLSAPAAGGAPHPGADPGRLGADQKLEKKRRPSRGQFRGRGQGGGEEAGEGAGRGAPSSRRRQRLASALQQVQQSLQQRGQCRTGRRREPGRARSDPGSPQGTAGASGEGGEANQPADYNYRQTVRQLYTNEMNVVYRARFAAATSPPGAGAVDDAPARWSRGKMEAGSGDAILRQRGKNILRG